MRRRRRRTGRGFKALYDATPLRLAGIGAAHRAGAATHHVAHRVRAAFRGVSPCVQAGKGRALILRVERAGIDATADLDSNLHR